MKGLLILIHFYFCILNAAFGFSSNNKIVRCAGNYKAVNFISVTNFTATQQNTSVQLKWDLSCDFPTAITIEKSSDALTFKTAGLVECADTKSQKENFSYTDGNPAVGFNYYRLKMIEITGLIKYSPTIEISYQHQSSEFLIFPNPATQKQLHINTLSVNATGLIITSGTGKEVYQINNLLRANDVIIDLPELTSGAYTVTLFTEYGVTRRLIFIQ